MHFNHTQSFLYMFINSSENKSKNFGNNSKIRKTTRYNATILDSNQ